MSLIDSLLSLAESISLSHSRPSQSESEWTWGDVGGPEIEAAILSLDADDTICKTGPCIVCSGPTHGLYDSTECDNCAGLMHNFVKPTQKKASCSQLHRARKGGCYD